jgi:hypothetical protein
MPSATLTGWPSRIGRVELGRVVDGCPVCDSPACQSGNPDVQHSYRYPFLPGGVVPEPVETVHVGERVFDPATGILLYGAADPMPRAEAERLGLVAPKAPEEPAPQGASKPTVRTRPRPGRETR